MQKDGMLPSFGGVMGEYAAEIATHQITDAMFGNLQAAGALPSFGGVMNSYARDIQDYNAEQQRLLAESKLIESMSTGFNISDDAKAYALNKVGAAFDSAPRGSARAQYDAAKWEKIHATSDNFKQAGIPGAEYGISDAGFNYIDPSITLDDVKAAVFPMITRAGQEYNGGTFGSNLSGYVKNNINTGLNLLKPANPIANALDAFGVPDFRFEIQSNELFGAAISEGVNWLAGGLEVPGARALSRASGVLDNVPNSVESFSSNAAFGGKLYPDKKLNQLVQYLEKRGVYVWETKGNPKFVAKWDGTGELHLPANPTELQVKHELSHYLDFRNKIANSNSVREGVQNYVDMGRLGREQSVLDRLQNNRIWNQLNEVERSFSINYVESIKVEAGQ